MRTWHAIAMVPLLVGCRHEPIPSEPPVSYGIRTLDASVVHQKMPGTWLNGQDKSYFYHIMRLDTNGDFFIAKGGETTHRVGTWKLQEPGEFVTNEFGRVAFRAFSNHGSDLYVTYGKPSATNYDVDIFPVIYIDNNELLLSPGFSVGGSPFRFIREN